MSFINKIFGDPNEKYIKSLQPIVDEINGLEGDFERLSDEELKSKTEEFKKQLGDGKSLDDILPQAFATVREASKRTLGQRHFDVQLMGGIVLHRGNIAEMRTGEGKTLVATLPAYLNALAGKGVHLVTVNDYLARRDTAWMGQIYNKLGLTVGCINHEGSYLYDAEHSHENQNAKINSDSRLRTGTFDEQIKNDPFDKTQGHPEQSRTDDNSKLKNEREEEDKERDQLGSFKIVYEFLRPAEKKEAYHADITYGTNNEYGFDYLRDNMTYDSDQMSQRKEHAFAIIDEVDSILIDEARTPLIISAPDAESTQLYDTFSKIVPNFVENQDYNVDEKLKAVSITESGIEKVEKILGISNIYDEGGIRHVHHLEQALKAHVLFKRDKDYVVKDGEVTIVDEFTGRLMPGRRWSDGLHQAVEAKEGVSVRKESRTLATITFQNYFRLYDKLSGMTGTAITSAEEFHKVYSIDVLSIPSNKPLAREDLADRIYKTQMGKFKAVAREIKERHEKGQPVLVGTVSIEKNELLSVMLNREGVKHNVLNAKNHEKEAEITAQAGRSGAVTVATNMAGRGIDIVLGGNPPDKEESEKVRNLGGLYVIGTERHEARRIDDQLRGRAGRQGDPGSSQFFVSTEDDVARIFGGDRMRGLMEKLGIGEDDVIENKMISRAIEQAQSKIEGHNFDARKYVLEYDDVMNKHREAIYNLRREVLFSDNVKEVVEKYISDVIKKLVVFHAREELSEWNTEEIAETIKAMTGTSASFNKTQDSLLSTSNDNNLHSELINIASSHDHDKLNEFLIKYVLERYEEKEKEVSSESMRKLEKFVLLRTVDELWMDHIGTMEELRDSVRLRAYGQRDPLVEYKIEGQKMFENLQEAVKAQVANLIFKVSLTQQPKEQRKLEERRPDIVGDSSDHKHQENINQPIHRQKSGDSAPKVGRNDPCWCGAKRLDGRPKKFKHCHGK